MQSESSVLKVQLDALAVRIQNTGSTNRHPGGQNTKHR